MAETTWVVVKHNVTGGVTVVARQSYDHNLKLNGWELVSSSNSNKDELIEAAGMLGKVTTGKESVKDLEALIDTSLPADSGEPSAEETTRVKRGPQA